LLFDLTANRITFFSKQVYICASKARIRLWQYWCCRSGGQVCTEHHLLNIWEFVYFSGPLLLNPRRTMAKFSLIRVPTMCRTCKGFYVYRGRRYENNIFPKMCACRPRLLLRWPQQWVSPVMKIKWFASQNATHFRVFANQFNNLAHSGANHLVVHGNVSVRFISIQPCGASNRTVL